MNDSRIVTNKAGRMVGKIEDRVFIKFVVGSKHMLRMPMAWAIDADIFDKVVAPHCSVIRIVDTETGTMYSAPVSLFKTFRMKMNRQSGEQYYLTLVRWEVSKTDRRF